MKLLRVLLCFCSLLCLSELTLANQSHRIHQPFYSLKPSANFKAPALAAEINRIIRSSNQTTDIGIFVKSMSRGDTLFTQNIHQAFIPASTQKIMTAEAALLYLGPNFHFTTQIATDAKGIKDGILQGNLYVIQSGDPTLTYRHLVDLFLHLRARKIHGIAGNVYIDNTAYDQIFYGPGLSEKDKSHCWAAPISASIINHNCLSFKVMPSKFLGHVAQLQTSPNYFYPAIKNSVITRSPRTRSCFLRLTANPSSNIALNGCLPKGHFASGISAVITDVPDYNRALFKNLLNRLAITVYGRVTFGSTAPRYLSLIGVHESQPLKELIHTMLKKSDNVIAGAVFKKLGQVFTRQPGSWRNGGYAVSRILATRAGVNTPQLQVTDGSGISRTNQATPAQMMQVLNFAYHHNGTRNEFISALPIAGIDGTLKHRMGHVARKVRAKTGTISGVIGLAGYATSRNHEDLAFVMLFNGSNGMKWQYKALEDKIATALTQFQR